MDAFRIVIIWFSAGAIGGALFNRLLFDDSRKNGSEDARRQLRFLLTEVPEGRFVVFGLYLLGGPLLLAFVSLIYVLGSVERLGHWIARQLF